MADQLTQRVLHLGMVDKEDIEPDEWEDFEQELDELDDREKQGAEEVAT